MIYRVGDLVKHIGTRQIAMVQEIRKCRDGTQELKVFTDRWWNSSKVRPIAD